MTLDVLILSSLYDFSTDLVCVELEKAGTKYLRINREQLELSQFVYRPHDGAFFISQGSHTYSLSHDSLKSIYYRWPTFLRNHQPNLSIEDQFKRSQWMGFIRSLSIFKLQRWLNHPTQTYEAECKPLQLCTAYNLGFKIPRTQIGNSSSLPNEFGSNLILKSVDTVLLKDSAHSYFPYSESYVRDEVDWDGMNTCPLIIQEEIRNKIDIRATVIGSDIFSFRILNEHAGIAGDWRKVDRAKVSYQPVEISGETRDRCFALCRELGLTFAGIDLMQSGDDTYFVEVNPTGEWGWLNSPDSPIATKIAGYLNAA